MLTFLNFKTFPLISKLLIFNLLEDLMLLSQVSTIQRTHLRIFTFFSLSPTFLQSFCIDLVLKETLVSLISKVDLLHLSNLVLGLIFFKAMNWPMMISNSLVFFNTNQTQYSYLNVNSKKIFMWLSNNLVLTLEVTMLSFAPIVLVVTTIMNKPDSYMQPLTAWVYSHHLDSTNLALLMLLLILIPIPKSLI